MYKKRQIQVRIQKLQCLECKKHQQEEYKRKGCCGKIANQVKTLVKESCGIRSISRILKISATTVIAVIKREAEKIEKPKVKMGRNYEADELKTYVKKKKNEQWVIYAIDKKTKQVADFRIGRRNKGNLKNVITTLLLSKAKKIYTDGLSTYRSLIPKELHKSVPHNTNYIERKNLDLRTHLKRLSRKTICFSKSITMLTAVMKIYFWG